MLFTMLAFAPTPELEIFIYWPRVTAFSAGNPITALYGTCVTFPKILPEFMFIVG